MPSQQLPAKVSAMPGDLPVSPQTTYQAPVCSSHSQPPVMSPAPLSGKSMGRSGQGLEVASSTVQAPWSAGNK